MQFSQPITGIIRKRFSCRVYLHQPIAKEKRQRLQDFVTALELGPLGAPARFTLAAASEADWSALRGLGTYGFIRGATAFIVGALGPGARNLEDYGFSMECIILFTTDLGLGTCCLGGSFTKNSFARKISATNDELVPAVVSVGHIADEDRAREAVLRRMARAKHRLPWDGLFFREKFGVSLSHDDAGAYATPLEMVRVGPSASNKQPWRIIQDGNAWHFYLQRTPKYGRGSFVFNVLGLADLQRVDMGIAMCHFELTAREHGLRGKWAVDDPGIARPDELTEYTASWVDECKI